MMRVNNLTLKINQRVLIEQLSINVNPGQLWLVIGQNGVGKSTLLETLVGLNASYHSFVFINEKPLSFYNALSLAKMRAWLPQHMHMVFGYSVFEYVLASSYANLSETNHETKALEIIEELNLTHLIQNDVRTLSGGEQKRVALASTLMQDTPLLFLDEPLSFLDVAHQMLFVQHVQKCLNQQKSIVMATHDINELSACATHVLLLYDNGQWEAGLAKDLLTTQKLSACLGYPIVEVDNGERRVFVAQ